MQVFYYKKSKTYQKSDSKYFNITTLKELVHKALYKKVILSHPNVLKIICTILSFLGRIALIFQNSLFFTSFFYTSFFLC